MLDSHATARRLRQLVPHADVTVLPEMGHAVTIDSQDIPHFLAEGQNR